MAYQSLRTIHDEHTALAAVLRSLTLLLDRGPGDEPEQFFDVMRAMLFYIDEFPERQHHPKESRLLFPRVGQLAPETLSTIEQLDRDHAAGEYKVRELQHLLLAWELMGDDRQDAFARAARGYRDFYLEHMRLEETIVMPAAKKHLTDADWKALDAAFSTHRDPMVNPELRDPVYERLYTRIVMRAPAPIGLGASRSTA